MTNMTISIPSELCEKMKKHADNINEKEEPNE
jgi:hypothetical protein